MYILKDSTFNLLDDNVDYLFLRQVISSMIDPFRSIAVNSLHPTMLTPESSGQMASARKKFEHSVTGSRHLGTTLVKWTFDWLRGM